MTGYIPSYLCLVTTAQHLTIQSDNARTHNASKVAILKEPAPKQTTRFPTRFRRKNPSACIPRSQAVLLMSRSEHEQSCGMIMEDPAQQFFFKQMPRHSLTSNAIKPERKRSSETIEFDNDDGTMRLIPSSKGADKQLGPIKPERKASLEELERDESFLFTSSSLTSLHMAHVAARTAMIPTREQQRHTVSIMSSIV